MTSESSIRLIPSPLMDLIGGAIYGMRGSATDQFQNETVKKATETVQRIALATIGIAAAYYTGFYALSLVAGAALSAPTALMVGGFYATYLGGSIIGTAFSAGSLYQFIGGIALIALGMKALEKYDDSKYKVGLVESTIKSVANNQTERTAKKPAETTISEMLDSKGSFSIPKTVQNLAQLYDYIRNNPDIEEQMQEACKAEDRNKPRNFSLIFEENNLKINSALLDSFTLTYHELDIVFKTIEFGPLFREKKSVLCTDGKLVHLNGFEIAILKNKSDYFKAFFSGNFTDDRLEFSSDVLKLMLLSRDDFTHALNTLDLDEDDLINLLKITGITLMPSLEKAVVNQIILHEEPPAIGNPSPHSIKQLKLFNKAMMYHKIATENRLHTLKENCEKYFEEVAMRAYRSSNHRLYANIITRLKELDIETVTLYPNSQSRGIKVNVKEFIPEIHTR